MKPQLRLSLLYVLLLSVVATQLFARSRTLQTPQQKSIPAMSGGDASRSRSLKLAAPSTAPQKLAWKTEQLFALRGSSADFQAGPRFPVERIDFGPTYNLSSLIVADENLFFSFNQRHGYFYALDALTGKLLITLKFDDNFVSSPAAIGSVAIFGTRSGRVYAYDARTQKIKWGFEDKSKTFGTAPAIEDGVLYVSANKDAIYALDANTGKAKWIYADESSFGRVAVHSEYIVALDGPAGLTALNKATGEKVWRVKIDRMNLDPAILDDQVFLVHERGEIQSRSITDGSLKWRHKKNGGANGYVALASGMVVYAANDKGIVALNASDGEVKWIFKTGDLCRPPVIAGSVVVSSCTDRRIYAINLETGAQLWRYENKKGDPPTPTFGNGKMYLLATDGVLYAAE